MEIECDKLINPFWKFYEFGVTEMFNQKWEIRLAATMIIKVLLK